MAKYKDIFGNVRECEDKTITISLIWDKSGWKTKWLRRKDLYYWAAEDIQSMEIIGNIFDNPELLESEEN